MSFGVQANETYKKEGVLEFEYGDGQHGEYITRYHLQTDAGKLSLNFSDVFMKKAPIHGWLGKRVEIQSQTPIKASGEQRVNVIKLIENVAGSNVSGSQPWVSIACKFNDVAVEPNDQAYFNGMYANQPGGLDHYWREVSHDTINVAGSMAVDWVSLPSDREVYVPVIDGSEDADLDLLFEDCTAASDHLVDFSDAGNGSAFAGINMMFNDDLDCCAWGGGKWYLLDGVQKVWRVTWEPPWSYSNEGVIAHEMGHGFGLPHANNSDGDGNPYDNVWDVMSSATGFAVDDNIYGRLGKHINMSFKRRLGWVNDNEGYIAQADSDETVIIDETSMASTTNERFALIPLSDGSYYTVEARMKRGNYESNLYGEGIVIHHVIEGRSEPPWVVSTDNPQSDNERREGEVWKVGETFVDGIDGFSVEVLSVTSNGFQVRIKSIDDLIFADGFDS